MSSPSSPSRRAVLGWLGAASGAGLLASCASVLGPRQVEVPLHKLQAGLEKQFPINQRLMQVFDLQLSQPQLALLPDQDRVAVAFDASISPPFARAAWRGKMTVSGRLFVDAGRRAVMLAEPRIERLQFGDAANAQITRLANGMVDSLVHDMALYTFRDTELRYAGVQFVPLRIETRSSALLVTLTPAS